MYAIIESGSKQYRVAPGDLVNVDKMDVNSGDEVSFDCLFYSDGKKNKIGKPLLKDVQVKGKVIEHGKEKKVIVFKYKPKKNIRKKTGHRQQFTTVEILDF